ncbi:hypothetical protein QE152_g6211 [Popillia japonica]|uniref:Uncharacterized protein n=1 Tax=Popillia japonica TaxID=7064 RepID=A0AAW1MJ36_POPJA
MGKDQELLEAARNGQVGIVEKILGQRAKRSGPLARIQEFAFDNCLNLENNIKQIIIQNSRICIHLNLNSHVRIKMELLDCQMKFGEISSLILAAESPRNLSWNRIRVVEDVEVMMGNVTTSDWILLVLHTTKTTVNLNAIP